MVRVRWSCCLIVASAFSTMPLLAQINAAAGTNHSEQFIEVAGRVLDASQQPISDAAVTLVTGADFTVNWFKDFDSTRETKSTKTDAAGQFRIGFQPSDAPFMASGDRVLIVRAKGYQTYAIALPVQRMLSDAPLEVQLSPKEEVTVSVRTPEGDALESAELAVAAMGGVRIPWTALGQSDFVLTDSKGNATVNECSRTTLDAVFVVHPDIGQQRLPVTTSADGALVAEVAPVRRIQGKIESQDSSAIPGLDELKLLVVSAPLEKYQHPNTPLEAGWDFVSISTDGSFEVPRMALGELMYALNCDRSFAWRDNLEGDPPSLTADSSGSPWSWKIQFQRQPQLFVTILNEQGEPLPNIHILNYDGRLEPTITDAEGRASFFRRGTRSSYYPADTTGKYFAPDAFFQYADMPPVNGVVEFPPMRLLQSTDWLGRVVDQEGDGVGGAAITYEFSQERFNRTQNVYSDADGSFSLVDVADGTAVKLTATTDTHASETKSILLPSSPGLKLQLVEQPIAEPIGRLVDLQGAPVVGARVSIYRALVQQKEAYGRETLSSQPLYSPPVAARTDDAGHFRFPPTKDYAQRLRIEIDDPRYFELCSPYIDAKSLVTADKDGERTADLGHFQIMRRPESRCVVVETVTPGGKPIANAEFVFVGARVRKVVGETDKDGSALIDLQQGPGIVAVRAEGFHVHFGSFDASKTTENYVVTLVPKSAPGRTLRESKSIAAISDAELSDAANRMFRNWEAPNPAETTFHRLRLYLNALASVSPAEIVKFLENSASNPQVIQAATSSLGTAVRREPTLIEMVASSGLVEGPMQTGLWLTAANATNDQEQRVEWLGEALVSANQPYAKAYCVTAFLAAEEVELAEQAAADLWENATQLKELIASNTRKQQIGDARLIAPAIAVIDLESALQLIELTAAENEIGSLKTHAVLNWGMKHRDQLMAKLTAVELAESVSRDELARGISSWLGSIRRCDKLGFDGITSPLAVAKLINDENVRVEFLLFHAKATQDESVRRQLIEQLIATIWQTEPATAADTYSHYLQTLTESRSFLLTLPPSELDQLIFAALHQLPPNFDGHRMHPILASAAVVLAYRDRELGRILLEPAFIDRGWMFSASHFDRNKVTDAVGHIDPAWAIEIASQLSQAEYRHDAVDQLELRSGLIQSLMSPR